VDQAAVLRRIKSRDKALHVPASVIGSSPRAVERRKQTQTRVIAITSGKGGVGKTHISANLAYIFSKMKHKTLILDADTGLANIDVVLGLTPKYNLEHVLRGEKTLEEVFIPGPGGLTILPAASGVQEMATLSTDNKRVLLQELETIDNMFDFMLIDTGAGIANNVMYFNMAAQEIIVVVTPEPTSLTDAYAMIKILYQAHREKRIMVLVNMVRSPYEARDVFSKLNNASEHFLNLKIEYLGYVLHDERVTEAVRRQGALVELYPHSQASKCLFTIAEKICHEQPVNVNSGSIKFFSKAIVDRDHG
jgi:flagellar biosynthesis protein FlhG